MGLLVLRRRLTERPASDCRLRSIEIEKIPWIKRLTRKAQVFFASHFRKFVFFLQFVSFLLHLIDFVPHASFLVTCEPCCFCSYFRGTPRAESKVWGDCDPKPDAGVLEGFIQVHVSSRRYVTRQQRAETAPHRNSTLPEDSGPAGREMHTAKSRRVTAQEGLGNGYIRSKLLPLVDRMT